jgi:hypothetical protein
LLFHRLVPFQYHEYNDDKDNDAVADDCYDGCDDDDDDDDDALFDKNKR